jgi:L-fuculose-phosphate aldolase
VREYDLIKMASALTPFVVGAEGNVSCRADHGFTIKGSGKKFKNISASSLSLCDKDGEPINDTVCRPSMEAAFHALLYKVNPEINFIAHTHPVNCLKILTSYHDTMRFANERYFPDQVVFNGVKSCVVPYAKPGEELAKQISGALYEFDRFPEVFLLRNHGIICCGKTADSCIVATEICEKAATIFHYTSEPLSPQQVAELVNDEKEKFRKDLL